MDKHFVHQEKLFLEEFDKSSEKIVQIFSKEEMLEETEKAFAQGEESGYKKGFDVGTSKAISAHEERVLETVGKLNEQVGTLLEMMHCYNSSYSSDFFDIVYTIFKKVLPYYMKTHGKDEMQFFVKEILSKILRKEGVRINVHKDIRGDLQRILKNEGLDFGKIELNSDNISSQNEASITWMDGGASIDLENFYEQVNNIFEVVKSNKDSKEPQDVDSEALQE